MYICSRIRAWSLICSEKTIVLFEKAAMQLMPEAVTVFLCVNKSVLVCLICIYFLITVYCFEIPKTPVDKILLIG
jgi:hypothetical protein